MNMLDVTEALEQAEAERAMRDRLWRHPDIAIPARVVWSVVVAFWLVVALVVFA